MSGAFVSVKDSKYHSKRIVNVDEYIRCIVFDEKALCMCDSLETYLKLRKAGAVRVRGKRFLERQLNDPRAFHYWVENKSMVFDIHGGVQQIIDKESFYKRMEITDVSIAEYSGFFKEELPDCANKKHLKKLYKYMKDGVDDALMLLLASNYIKQYTKK
jgi:hypothetical protein